MVSAGVASVELDRAAFLGGRMRRETALILGANCADDGLSALDLPADFSRSAHWRAALERADFIPTFEMVNQLDGVLALAGSSLKYTPTAVEVESLPFGPVARELRARFGLVPTIDDLPEVDIEIGSGLSPFAESIRARDRMLITGPIVRGTVLLLFQALFLTWIHGAISSLAWPVVFGLPALLAFALVVALPIAERVFTTVCGRWRSSTSGERLRAITENRMAAGLPISHDGAWYQPGESIHLVSSFRLEAQRAGVAADAMERMVIVLGLNVGVALAFATASLIVGVEASAMAALVSLTVIIGLLAGTTHQAGIRAQKRLQDAIKIGLGLHPPPEPPAAPREPETAQPDH